MLSGSGNWTSSSFSCPIFTVATNGTNAIFTFSGFVSFPKRISTKSVAARRRESILAGFPNCIEPVLSSTIATSSPVVSKITVEVPVIVISSKSPTGEIPRKRVWIVAVAVKVTWLSVWLRVRLATVPILFDPKFASK